MAGAPDAAAACQCDHHHHETAEDLERLEREALGRVVLAFRHYAEDANREVDRWEWNFKQLPAHHRALLQESQLAKYKTARQCIYNNQFFIRSMLAAFDPPEEDDEEGAGGEPAAPAMLAGANTAADQLLQQEQQAGGAQQGRAGAQARTPLGDVEKVRYVLKNLTRDWSEEGRAEREASYARIVRELQRLFQGWESKGEGAQRPRVLLPGAGLARLCCEVAGAGFEAQGNEFAYFMLVASSFVLNAIQERDQYTIFPWVTASCNVQADSDQLRGVQLPDVHPVEIVSRAGVPGLLSMAAGDFVEVYCAPNQAGAWDAVATCFFIDTAHNVIQYLEVIAHCLKVGGYWVNLGPLLYHWADGYGTSELSLELSLAEIRRAAEALGLSMVREESNVAAPYIANVRSMYQTVYQTSFWTMQKTRELPAASAEALRQYHHAHPLPLQHQDR